MASTSPIADAGSRSGRAGAQVTAILSVLGLLSAFGVNITAEQVTAILAVGVPVLSFVQALVEWRFGVALFRAAPTTKPRPKRRRRVKGKPRRS